MSNLEQAIAKAIFKRRFPYIEEPGLTNRWYEDDAARQEACEYAIAAAKVSQETITTLTSQRDMLVKALKLFECIDFDHFTEHDELLLETVREDVRALLAELSKEGA